MPEEETNHEVRGRVGVNVVFDLDGVILRWVNTHLPNFRDQQAMLESVSELKKEGGRIFVLTNRPPGQMAPIAYDLGVASGYWVTESGASYYDPLNHRAYINPAWERFARERVQPLRALLSEKLDMPSAPSSPRSPQFEPGMGFVKTVLLPPEEVSLADFGSQIKTILEEAGFGDDFTVVVGKAIDVDPVGLSKADGARFLMELNGIDPTKTPTIFVADHDRDIAAADVFSQAGGEVASVGNGSANYINAVSRRGGIIAPSSTSYHSSVAYIITKFLERLRV